MEFRKNLRELCFGNGPNQAQLGNNRENRPFIFNNCEYFIF